ncbi:MAG: hypothetical protein L0Y72_09955 [Gemmataceae bacterium]|nr:hypothetical protein [Gemmataceae bacterium]
MAIDARFEEALHSSDRVGALRKLAQRLLDEGSEPAVLCAQFEQVRQELRKAAREDDEDAVMDVMDFLTGWCSPHMKLQDKPVQTEQKQPASRES